MKNWLEYFETNRRNRHPIPWERGITVEPHLRSHLIRSLQRFQVGESGEGRHLRRKAATTGDTSYEAATDLFIKEEQEHARLMAVALRLMGGTLLKRHWSDACFVILRRLFSLRGELLVLLIPEMIAKRYFRAALDATSDPVLRAMFAQILHDEEGHLGFHIEYLRRQFASMPLPGRVVLRAVWNVVFHAACLVVVLDHGSLLRAAGIHRSMFWWDCGLIFDDVAAEILSSVPVSPRPAVVPQTATAP